MLLLSACSSSQHAFLALAGCTEGFVDLGQFETEGSGEEFADHGLVIVFLPFTGMESSKSSSMRALFKFAVSSHIVIAS